MFPSIQRLNSEQRAAATFEGDQLRILAGAGTGKTTTLIARVAWLVASGIPAERVMALTFTRRAAREMMHRCDGLRSVAALCDHAHSRLRPEQQAKLAAGRDVMVRNDGADFVRHRLKVTQTIYNLHSGTHTCIDVGCCEMVGNKVLWISGKPRTSYT